jgi:hypothetical protein
VHAGRGIAAAPRGCRREVPAQPLLDDERRTIVEMMAKGCGVHQLGCGP